MRRHSARTPSISDSSRTSSGIRSRWRWARFPAAAEGARGGRALGGGIVERNLRRTGDLIDNTLNQVTLRLGVEPHVERIDLDKLLHELALDLDVEAQAKGIEIVRLRRWCVDRRRRSARCLRSAFANLLHNALKFSHERSTVSVRTKRGDGADLGRGRRWLRRPPARSRRGAIRRRSSSAPTTAPATASASRSPCRQRRPTTGRSPCRDVPGTGCVFTVTLPVAPTVG